MVPKRKKHLGTNTNQSEATVNTNKVKKSVVCLNKEKSSLKPKNTEVKITVLETGNEDPNLNCIFCDEHFHASKSNEEWIQCTECLKWAHYLCTNLSPSAGTDLSYVCDLCFNFE